MCGCSCVGVIVRAGVYLGERELADDFKRMVGDDDFAVMLDPALTPENVMNARGSLVPRVMLLMPTYKEWKKSYSHAKNSPVIGSFFIFNIIR